MTVVGISGTSGVDKHSGKRDAYSGGVHATRHVADRRSASGDWQWDFRMGNVPIDGEMKQKKRGSWTVAKHFLRSTGIF